MHTLVAIASGFCLLWLVQRLARFFNLRPGIADRAFALLWLVACAIHGLMGIAAGYSIAMELAVGTLVFLVPPAGLAARRRYAARNKDTGQP
ncbi:hypothetical protein CYR55_04655 [Chimaeribacter californicus]|uniref:Uncharacterized protein n=1 Tax=Chimaeribacter californicus TaxID=2060067 RepID=A0A2N5EFB8_9GAMM|nr:hypothetical protein [Chimaeribacter californicus]PLR41196.1 hypothetical protein CYR55_04655 [Chimaeribacter californicus]